MARIELYIDAPNLRRTNETQHRTAQLATDYKFATLERQDTTPEEDEFAATAPPDTQSERTIDPSVDAQQFYQQNPKTAETDIGNISVQNKGVFGGNMSKALKQMNYGTNQRDI